MKKLLILSAFVALNLCTVSCTQDDVSDSGGITNTQQAEDTGGITGNPPVTPPPPPGGIKP